jgi:carbon-monoxide dehydrogenase medium subunit
LVHRFEYHAPETLDEALALLAEHGDNARVLAGGTVLLKDIREGHIHPPHLINIKRIDELHRLEADGEGLHIGALAIVSDVMKLSAVQADFPVLAEAIATMAAVQVRNMATMGGNLCNASPAADTAPPLMILDAEVEIAGPQGRRTMPVGDFFVGPRQSALEKGEILVGVRVPKPPADWSCTFLKMAPRGAMEIAVASVGVGLKRSNGTCEDVKIVMGAVAPTPVHAQDAEAALRGNPLDEATIQEAARLAAEATQPIDDMRSSAWYRKITIETLTRRALTRLAGEIA